MNSTDKQVLVVEDNIKGMELACNILDSIHNIIIFKAKESGQAYKYALEYNIDLFIVDIILNTTVFADISGIKFIEEIRSIEKYKFTPIIITTSLEDPKLHAYSYLHCFRYFEKPYDKDEFREAVTEALQYKTIKEEKLFYNYKYDGVLYMVKIKEIVYFQTINGVTNIHCENGKVLRTPYRSSKNILLELNSPTFLRCSSNTIVNVKFIEEVDSTNRYVMLSGNLGTLDIGPRIKKRFLEDLRKC